MAELQREAGRQAGAVLVLLLLVLTSLLAFLVFAIDIPRKEIARDELRSALDMSALAAAAQLDGTAAGVERAVEAVTRTVSRNMPKGASLDFEPADNVSFGLYGKIPCADHPPPCEDEVCEACLEASPLKEIYRFRALRGAFESGLFFGGAPVESISNAVRVHAGAASRGAFTGIYRSLGFDQAGNTGPIGVTSVAVADRELERCVFPLAIPACQLFVNPDPNDEERLSTAEFLPEEQCSRDVLFSESSLMDNWVFPVRGLGWRRYQELNRLEHADYTLAGNACGGVPGTTGPNCRKQGMQGVIALPLDEGENPGGDASPEQAVSLFESWIAADAEDRCLPVALGQTLKPLDNALDNANGLLSEEGLRERLGAALAELFSPGDPAVRPFSEVFGETGSAGNPPRRNYPFMRNDLVDRILTWPPFGPQQRILLDAMGPWQWTNPLCHDPRIPANDVNQSMVREVTVMAIASGVDNVAYCDPETNLLRRGQQNAWPPYKDTRPIVVGFLRAYLIDFNYRQLSAEFPDESPEFSGITDGGPMGIALTP